MEMTMRNKLYINGIWKSPAKGGTIAVINPATEETIRNISDEPWGWYIK